MKSFTEFVYRTVQLSRSRPFRQVYLRPVLPDKAIDLMDEAAARLRTEIDSMPVELDEIKRKITQLQIEETALKKEKDDTSIKRLENIREQISELGKSFEEMEAVWHKEKEEISRVHKIKSEIESVKLEIEKSEREYDLNKAAELKFGKLNELEENLQLKKRPLNKGKNKEAF